MKRKIIIMLLASTLLLCGCGNTDNATNQKQDDKEKTEESVSDSKENTSSSVSSDTPELSDEEFEKQFREACQEYSYEDIARYTDDLNGEYVKVLVEIDQIFKDDTDTTYVGYMDTDGDYIFNNPVYILDCRPSGGNILDGDLLEIYAMVDGQNVLTTTENNDVYVPQIDMMFCDLMELTEETDSSEPEISETEYYLIGDVAEKYGIKISLNSISDYTDYDKEDGPKDGMKIIKSDFYFENTDTSDFSVSEFDFECYADNASCEQTFSDEDLSATLPNGKNTSGSVFFIVPENADEIELQYIPGSWNGDKAVFKNK